MGNIVKSLDILIAEKGIAQMPHGKKQDALGHVVEKHYHDLFNSSAMLARYHTNSLSELNNDECAFKRVLDSGLFGDTQTIVQLKSTLDVKHLMSGGYAKTDLIIEATYSNGQVKRVPLGLKHTTTKKVAVAEFGVDAIIAGVGIQDAVLISYLHKHQVDGSAKNFTKVEKKDFGERMMLYATDFVRWAITGSSNATEPDLRCPKLFIQLDMDKNNLSVKKINVMTVDQYMNKIMYTAKGKRKTGGYYTGLSFTYATGSKGKKMQFKA